MSRWRSASISSKTRNSTNNCLSCDFSMSPLMNPGLDAPVVSLSRCFGHCGGTLHFESCLCSFSFRLCTDDQRKQCRALRAVRRQLMPQLVRCDFQNRRALLEQSSQIRSTHFRDFNIFDLRFQCSVFHVPLKSYLNQSHFIPGQNDVRSNEVISMDSIS
jgi:hypothetical protein